MVAGHERQVKTLRVLPEVAARLCSSHVANIEAGATLGSDEGSGPRGRHIRGHPSRGYGDTERVLVDNPIPEAARPYGPGPIPPPGRTSPSAPLLRGFARACRPPRSLWQCRRRQPRRRPMATDRPKVVPVDQDRPRQPSRWSWVPLGAIAIPLRAGAVFGSARKAVACCRRKPSRYLSFAERSPAATREREVDSC
jgi:hypothetical protein